MAYRKDKYDKALVETPEWKYLYAKWQRIGKHRGEYFATFMNFYNWSFANGFTVGAMLELLDINKPYSPENCQWVHSENQQRTYREEDLEFINKWNKSVNRIRCYFGMEPLGQKGAQPDGQG